MVNKNILLILMVVGLLVVCGEGVFAATINALSCNQTDVQAAIDSAVDGERTQCVPTQVSNSAGFAP